MAALKIRPKDTQAMYELGLVEQGMDNASEALRWLEKGHALNRRNTLVSSLLVQLYISKNRTEAALNAAQETESALPDDLSALASLGEAYVAVGNLDRARTICDRMGVIAGFDVKGQYRVAVHQVHAKRVRSTR